MADSFLKRFFFCLRLVREIAVRKTNYEECRNAFFIVGFSYGNFSDEVQAKKKKKKFKYESAIKCHFEVLYQQQIINSKFTTAGFR